MHRNRRSRLPKPFRSTSKIRSSIGTVIEQLEERRLLAATPLITEFLADNVGGLKDQFGNSPDWIEIRNPVSQNFDIGGYYLTDDPNDLTKWQFPTGTALNGGSYMVVFASGDDVTVSGQPLHTNFSLTSSPGFLGLVAPDGTTVVSAYDYPQQLTNTSYGIAVTSTSSTLINPGALVKTLVPTNGTLGTTWTAPGFNDSTWKQGTTGVGYEADPPPPPTNQWAIRMVDTSAGSLGNIAQATTLLDGTYAPGTYTIASDSSNNYPFVNMAGGGNFPGDYVLPNGETNGDAPGRTQYALRVTATVTIPVGTYTLDVGSDDGFRLRIPNISFVSRYSEEFSGAQNPSPPDTLVFGTGRGHAHTGASFTVSGAPLTTTVQLDYFEGSGGDDLELSGALGTRTTFDTTNFTLVGNGWNGWTVSAPNVSPQQNYRSLISQDLTSDMYNQRTSAYMRIPFAISGTPTFDMLRLRMKYDDGFVAYLNGTKIAERNAPATPVWNSVATAEHPDAQAMVFEDIDVPIPAGLLINGNNILAIHGINDAANSPDFLMLPALLGLNTTTVGGGRYMTTPTPGALNSTSNVNGVVEDTHFSVKRGFFDNPFDLVITTDTPGAEIRYTLNGSAPTPTNGTVYTGPIHITGTTTLRAMAWKTGLVSSNVDTESYIFVNDVVNQSLSGQAPIVGGTQWPTGPINGQILDYGMDPDIVNNPTWAATIKNDLKSIPSINIAISPDDFFNPSTGVYVNPSGDGRAWERPVSVELIDPNGLEPGFQVNAGIRIRGGFSQSGDNPKHGLRLFFRQEYGDSKLKYPMFPDDPTATDEFDSIDLRTFENYSWSFGGDSNGIFMRDQLSRDMQLAEGQEGERGNYYHLYIDGQYWGIYNSAERPEASFAASYYGGNKDDYDVVKPAYGGGPLFATDGDLNAWQQLYDLSVQLGNVAQQIAVGYSSKTGNPVLGQTVSQLNTGALGTIAAIDGATGFITIKVTSGRFSNNVADLIRVNATNYVTPNNSQAIRNLSDEIYFKMQGQNPDGTRNPSYPILLDMDNLIDYMLVILHGGNLDAAISAFIGPNSGHNNWFGSRPRDGSAGFRFFAHDSEHTILPFNSSSFDRTGPWPNPATSNNPWPLSQSNPQYIWQQLGAARTDIGSPEFRLRVADHLQQQFFNNGALTTAQVLARFDKRKSQLDRAVVGESARWGDSKVATPYTRDTWLAAVSAARNFLTTRSGTVLNQLIGDGNWPKLNNGAGAQITAPVFSQFGGDISSNFVLSITHANGVNGTIFYTLDGSDSRLPGGGTSPTAIQYTGGVPLNSSAQVRARVRYNENGNILWSPVTTAKFKYNMSALHISELMYNPAPPPVGSPYTADDFEYIELQNTGTAALQLGGVHFDQGITFSFPNMTLTGNSRTLVVKNRAAFESRYGLGLPIAGEYINAAGGTLSNNGEDVNLVGSVGEQLIHFNYDNSWAPITNGGGYSLVVRDPTAGQIPTVQDPSNPLSQKSAWRASNLTGGGPGVADPGINPESIVINEAMSNSTAPTGDWIELKNLTGGSMNIGGWFLSNDPANLKKYQIPANTTLASNAYIVFFSQQTFGNAANPGVITPFDLDQVNGGDIYLTNNDGSNNVAGYREHADFGVGVAPDTYGSAPDVSFGRYVKSNGATDFAQLISPTPGAANTAPVVGPIVISEVNYNPNAGDSEFIELQNLNETPFQLWDPANPNHTWKFLSGVDFTFPTNTTIPGFGSLILIPQTISSAAFRAQYNVPAAVQIFQYAGGLDNGGEDLKLGRPLPGAASPTVYTLADKLKYADLLPWPVAADGTGPTLQIVQPIDYGNDPANWRAGPNHGNPGIVQAPQRPPVVDVGADGNALQGSPFSRSGSFSDVNAEQTFTGTVNWGDGGVTQPLTLNADKTFTLNHTYLTTGIFTITVTITDSYPESGIDTMQVTVGPDTAPVVNAGPDASPVQGDTFSQSGSFADPDPGQTWSATVNWGDGGATVPLALNANKTFNLNHVYANVGNYTITVTVTDNASVSGSGTIQISTLPDSLPVVGAGPDQTIPQGGTFAGGGSFTDANAQQTWTATVNWGEGGAAVPLTLNANKTFNLSHLYNNPGTYNVLVTVTDSVGGGGTDNVSISVPPNARQGSDANDTEMLRLDATHTYIEFYENRTVAQGPSFVVKYSEVPDFSYNGAIGTDTLVIDLSNGNPIPAGGVSYAGGTNPVLGDLVQVIGTSGNDDIHVTSTQVAIGNLTVDYGSTERVQFDGLDGDDTMSIDESISFSPAFNGGTGNDTVNVNAGTWRLTTDSFLTTANLNLVGSNTGLVIATASQHLSSLTLNDSARFTLAANGTRVLRLSNVTIAPTTNLDLFDNNLVLNGTAANRDAMLAMIREFLRTGRNGGTWNGPGIKSVTATNNALRNTNLAAILNDQGNGTVVRGTFEGETVDNNAILVKYTYTGDANLDGVINPDDFALIDGGFNNGTGGYYNGDFDYSGGPPDADDYFAIDKSFSSQGAALGASTVPQAPLAGVSEAAEPSVVPSKAAVKVAAAQQPAKKKNHRHHKRDVIDQISEDDQIMFRKRD